MKNWVPVATDNRIANVFRGVEPGLEGDDTPKTSFVDRLSIPLLMSLITYDKEPLGCVGKL